MIYIRFLLLVDNGDGLCTIVIPLKDKVVAGSSHGSTAKGLAIDLQVTGSGPVNCSVSFSSSLFTMCILHYLVLSLVSHGT